MSFKEVKLITQKDFDDAGVTRLQVAQAIGMPYSTLSSKMNGFIPMEAKDVHKIRDYLISIKA